MYAKMFTNDALIGITNKVQVAYYQDSFNCGVYEDFKKTFDTVTIIFHFKNEITGVSEMKSNWFKSYLGTLQQPQQLVGFLKIKD